MQLQFIKLIDPAPSGEHIQMGHNPNNELVYYALRDYRVKNLVSYPDEGAYDDLTFGTLDARVPVRNYSIFGIKTFPGIGAYGWFRLKYEPGTHVLIPLSQSFSLSPPPTFTVQQLDYSIRIIITHPDSIEYSCYRVLFRKGYFADEYITYATTVDIPKPYNGTYELYVIGYKDTGEVSAETPRQNITITNSVNAPTGTLATNTRNGTSMSFWLGTDAEFEEILTKDPDTVYFRSDE